MSTIKNIVVFISNEQVQYTTCATENEARAVANRAYVAKFPVTITDLTHLTEAGNALLASVAAGKPVIPVPKAKPANTMAKVFLAVEGHYVKDAPAKWAATITSTKGVTTVSGVTPERHTDSHAVLMALAEGLRKIEELCGSSEVEVRGTNSALNTVEVTIHRGFKLADGKTPSANADILKEVAPLLMRHKVIFVRG